MGVSCAGPVIVAKTARGANSQNQNYKAALPTMIRNVEMLAAGKLLQEGRILQLVLSSCSHLLATVREVIGECHHNQGYFL